MAALIAFELTRALRATGDRPLHLFVAAARAPHFRQRGVPIHQLKDAEFLRALRLRVNGIAAALLQNADLLQAVLPVLRADIAHASSISMLRASRLIVRSPLLVAGRTTRSHCNSSQVDVFIREAAST